MLLPEIDDPWFEKLPIEFPPTVHKNHLSMYEPSALLCPATLNALTSYSFSFSYIVFLHTPLYIHIILLIY